jgi:DNA-binding response OmpR family regulator
VSIKTILIVESDAGISDFLALAIAQETPYQALLVNDSLCALEVTRAFVPDLLLLDYYLPHMNGIELYDRLQVREEFQNIPTILMSTNISRQQQELEKRTITGLGQPVELDDLLATIEGLLNEGSSLPEDTN